MKHEGKRGDTAAHHATGGTGAPSPGSGRGKRVPWRVGIVGCGNISAAYLENAARFPSIHIVELCDTVPEAAEHRSQEFGVPATSLEELLTNPEIDAVINLTPPAVHAGISRAVLEAGKHVYSEKPLAVTREEGSALMELARSRGVRLGCAPDTVLGAGTQSARAALDAGWIGTPLNATAIMQGGGPERWHPNPAFFYGRGGGPLLDMGPYYLTALVTLLGPIGRVRAVGRRGRAVRTAGSPGRLGETIPVEVDTFYAAILEHHGGAVTTLITSFDAVGGGTHPAVEIYGTEGTITAPDPNGFGGYAELRRPETPEPTRLPWNNPYHENSRIIGVVEMLDAVATDRPHRCSDELAYHVLDVMLAIQESADSDTPVSPADGCRRPEAMRTGMLPGLV